MEKARLGTGASRCYRPRSICFRAVLFMEDTGLPGKPRARLNLSMARSLVGTIKKIGMVYDVFLFAEVSRYNTVRPRLQDQVGRFLLIWQVPR